jgi:hypothetical protein
LSDLKKKKAPFIAGCALYTFIGDNKLHRSAFGAELIAKNTGVSARYIYTIDAD